MMKKLDFKILELTDWSMISLKQRLKELTKDFEQDQIKVKIKHKLGWYTATVFKIECDNPNCEDGVVDHDFYGHPIYCQLCTDK